MFNLSRHLRCPQLLVWGLLCGCALGMGTAATEAQETVRLLDQDPFDEIELKADQGGGVFKVAPLDLPGRRVPTKPPAGKMLRIRLLDRPGKDYEVAWQHLAEVRLYEHMLVDETKRLIAEQQFTEAFEYLAYLTERHPKLPGLDEIIDSLLLANAGAAFRQSELEQAYVQLLELHRRNPRHPAVSKALNAVADKLIAQWVREEKYVAARGVLTLLAARFPQEPPPVIASWEQRFSRRAEQLYGQAKTEFTAGKYGAARRLNRQALEIWPTLGAARSLAEEINAKAPQVVVGVSLPGYANLTDRLDDWASLRRRRLVSRTLAEQVGLGAEGGIYQSPLGSFETDPLSRQFAIQMRSGVAWSTGPGTITGYDVSRRLLQIAAPGDPGYRADWADLLEGVAVQDVYRVVVDMTRPHLRPQALLQIPLYPATVLNDDESLATPTFGPYRLETQAADLSRYLITSALAASGGPQEIVEQHFTEETAAVDALRKGDITLLDRVNPWQLAELSADSQLTVERYALPTIHVLIPNPRKPLVKRRTFRRALVYGIEREIILRQELLAGANVPGAALLSGPFPLRTSFDDPIGFASDEQLAPRPYEPRLAFALVQAALKELAAESKAAPQAADAPAAKEPPKKPQLVLAHPGEPIARAACLAIQAHLERIGVGVTLTEWNPGDPAASVEEYDLLYAQLAMWDPLVDARRLLGEGQLTGEGNPYVTLALRKLDQAVDSKEIRRRLQEIHRIVYDDVTVIPLWQLPEHFAYARNLSEVGERPLTLYQNVERWQVRVRLPGEK